MKFVQIILIALTISAVFSKRVETSRKRSSNSAGEEAAILKLMAEDHACDDKCEAAKATELDTRFKAKDSGTPFTEPAKKAGDKTVYDCAAYKVHINGALIKSLTQVDTKDACTINCAGFNEGAFELYVKYAKLQPKGVNKVAQLIQSFYEKTQVWDKVCRE
jgi:hypothetical protein